MTRSQTIYVVHSLATALDDETVRARIKRTYGEFGFNEMVAGARALCEEIHIEVPDELKD